MKMRLLRTLGGLALLSTLNPQLSTCFAQGTAFNYQGRLNDGANPAAGIYDLRFALYDTATAGFQQGSALTNAATAVSNGLFTVALDFGNQFPGANRWLEIAVRTNGGGAFTTLAPRQPLTPIPYAITAGSVVSGGLAPGTYANAVTLNNPANQFVGSFAGNGANVTNLNAGNIVAGTLADARLSTNVARLASANTFTAAQTISGTAQTPLQLNASNAGGTWFNLGNSSAEGHTWNVISSGSGNGEGPGKLLLRDSARGVVMALATNGNVGIGNSNPDRPLTLTGTGSSAEWLSLRNANNATVWHLNNYLGGVDFVQSGVADGRLFLSTNNGNVGIGSTTPLGKLEIQAGANNTGASDQMAISLAYRLGGYRHWIRSRHNGNFLAGNSLDFYLNTGSTASASSAPGTNNVLALTLDAANGGSVGIGTNAPAAKLDVNGTIRAAGGIVYPDGSIQIRSTDTTPLVTSGLPAGSTLTANFNGTAATLVSYEGIRAYSKTYDSGLNYSPQGGRTSYCKVRRSRTVDTNWTYWASEQPGANYPLALTLSIGGGGSISWTGVVKIVEYRLEMEGVAPVETLQLRATNFLTRTQTGSPIANAPSSPIPNTELLLTNVLQQGVVVLPGLAYTQSFDVATGIWSGHREESELLLRANPVSGSVLYSELAGVGLSGILVRQSGAPVTTSSGGTVSRCVLRIADDGLPVEEYTIKCNYP